MKVVGIIPSRMESTRLPNKPLKDICGLPMIIHVLKRCELSKVLGEVYIATDSIEIKNVVENFGGNVILTKKNHQTGTDRVAEASKSVKAEIIVNIQGDEALLNPRHIDKVTNILINNLNYDVAILVNSFKKEKSISDIKVVTNKYDEVLYFSRLDIPFRKKTDKEMLKAYHIVPFRKSFLNTFTNLPKGNLEIEESNEYLRIIENDFKIKTIKVNSLGISVDTKEDLKFVRKAMKKDQFYGYYKSLKRLK
tara:strand:- start:33 stop:785 length:753 start_codon:yes stop_codon:yes gene_type:complete